jgi:hypothetical protein
MSGANRQVDAEAQIGDQDQTVVTSRDGGPDAEIGGAVVSAKKPGVATRRSEATRRGALGSPYPHPQAAGSGVRTEAVMTLARKGTRLITVNKVRYRWVVAPDDEPGRRIVIERAEAPGQRMVTWVDHGAVITPHLVAGVIQQALDQGWTPERRATQIVFRINHSDMAALGRVAR